MAFDNRNGVGERSIDFNKMISSIKFRYHRKVFSISPSYKYWFFPLLKKVLNHSRNVSVGNRCVDDLKIYFHLFHSIGNKSFKLRIRNWLLTAHDVETLMIFRNSCFHIQ